MKLFAFLSRLAFICNLLFLVCLIFQRIPGFNGIEDVNGVVITLGWLLSPFLNLFVCIWYVTLFLRKKTITLTVWVVAANFLFLCIQIFIHFILPS